MIQKEVVYLATAWFRLNSVSLSLVRATLRFPEALQPCVCVCERESVCVCVRERECVCV